MSEVGNLNEDKLIKFKNFQEINIKIMLDFIYQYDEVLY